jgi:hypothetical protein
MKDMYVELKITIGPPKDQVTIWHCGPISSLNDIKKIPEHLVAFSHDFLPLEGHPLTSKKEPKVLLTNNVKYIDD